MYLFEKWPEKRKLGKDKSNILMCSTTSSNSEEIIPLGFSNLNVSVGDHIAHFYRGAKDRLNILGPYFIKGLERGDKCVLFSSSELAGELCDWFEQNGVDPDHVKNSGQLFMHQGAATGDAMLELAIKLESTSIQEGYIFIRACGDGGWSLEGTRRPREMLRWEVHLDNTIADWKVVALCQIDLELFDGKVVMDVMRCHGLCIMGDQLIPNPFHVSPDLLVEELF